MIYNVPVFFNGKNEGEKKVHEKLINLFQGKKYFALHSVKLPNHETKLNGECDFILITDRGILCLEVKGSSSVKRINKIDRTDGILDKDLWIYDTYNANESPFEQAEGATYPLKKMLAEDNLSRRNKFVIGHGVIFTEIEFNEKSLEWNDCHICSITKFQNNFELYLSELFDHFHERLKETKGVVIKNNPNIEDLKWVVQNIRPNVSHLSLVELNSSKNEIITMEEKQKLFVDQLIFSQKRQSIIDGNAGSGKTVILLETIHRINEKEKILLVCFNRQLSNYLSHRLKHKKNTKIFYFHSLLEYYCKKAGIEFQGDKNRVYDQELLPNLFEEALIELSEKIEKYDWLLVDEGQDFINESSFNNLVELLKNEKKGNYILAFDSGLQSGVYNKMDLGFLSKLKENGNRLDLYRNFRNPRSIAHRSASITGIKKPEVERKIISTPKIFEVKINESLENKINEVIYDLLKTGVSPQDITVLTSKSRKTSILSSMKSIAGKRTLDMKIRNLWDESNPDDFISWSTVSSFKGMENEYIVLIETDFKEFNDWYRSIIYVAMTRVRFEFIYVGYENDKMIDVIKNVGM